jgi:hypothetical protein
MVLQAWLLAFGARFLSPRFVVPRSSLRARSSPIRATKTVVVISPVSTDL